MASSEFITNWGAVLATLFAGAVVWRDWRKQNIQGSIPTELTNKLIDRVSTLEERDKQREKEHEAYRRSSRNWFYAATQAAAKGEPLPPPPEDWP